MPEIQRNKRFGLMKLKKIAGNEKNKWFVSPHITITTPEQLRLAKIRNPQRLLVRTDEKGKNYKHLSWELMPRFDTINESQHNTDKEMQNKINQQIKDGTLPLKTRGKIIIHPTKPRENIAFTGTAVVFVSQKKPFIQIEITSPDRIIHQFHRFLPRTYSFRFAIDNTGQQIANHPLTKIHNMEYYAKGWKETPLKEIPEFIKPLIQNVLEFTQKGIKEKQIKPKRFNADNYIQGRTELSFLSWKDAPQKAEFFDLLEKRVVQEKQLKKINNQQK